MPRGATSSRSLLPLISLRHPPSSSHLCPSRQATVRLLAVVRLHSRAFLSIIPVPLGQLVSSSRSQSPRFPPRRLIVGVFAPAPTPPRQAMPSSLLAFRCPQLAISAPPTLSTFLSKLQCCAVTLSMPSRSSSHTSSIQLKPSVKPSNTSCARKKPSDPRQVQCALLPTVDYRGSLTVMTAWRVLRRPCTGSRYVAPSSPRQELIIVFLLFSRRSR